MAAAVAMSTNFTNIKYVGDLIKHKFMSNSTNVNQDDFKLNCKTTVREDSDNAGTRVRP